MEEEIKKAGIKCNCGAELLVYQEGVFCQICKKWVKP
jgi:hypothetical protein